MGLNVSRQTEISENEYLLRFVGKEHIPIEDEEFWTNLLQFHIASPSTRSVFS